MARSARVPDLLLDEGQQVRGADRGGGEVITSIAEQTNLLALNATIEPHPRRRGRKGFAVIGNEVKDLARETATATRTSPGASRPSRPTPPARSPRSAEISEVIGRINDYQTTIAAAVEEQTATTNEMARNVAEAATGAGQIAENVVGVASAAGTTTTGVGESQRAAADLARMSNELQPWSATSAIDYPTGGRGAFPGAPRPRPREACRFIARQGFEAVYGARPLRRFIAREVETRIGRALLGGNVRTAR